MRLVAAMPVRNERSRYLELALAHLLEFVDAVVVIDDASDDGTREYLVDHPDDRVYVAFAQDPTFFEHEGRLRQRLLTETLALEPTHVLAIDADEFVADGLNLRMALIAEQDEPALTLEMREVWGATPDGLRVREDGGWRSHPVPVLWRVPENLSRLSPGYVAEHGWQIRDRALACGRVPQNVDALAHVKSSGAELLHMGWANPAERDARYQRYAVSDGGRFHASAHLRSILWPERKMRFSERPWPAGPVFEALRDRLALKTMTAKHSIIPDDVTDEEAERFLEALDS